MVREFAIFLVLMLIVVWYLLIPWWSYINHRILSQPTVEMIDGKNFPLPLAFRERLERDGNELRSLGFVPSFAYVSILAKGNGESVCYSFLNHATSTFASVSAILYGGPNGFVVSEMSFGLTTYYQQANKPTLQISNQDLVVEIGLRKQDVLCCFPHITSISRLLILHDKLNQRHFPDIAKEPLTDTETAEVFRLSTEFRYREVLEEWLSNGKLERIANETNYRHPAIYLFKYWWGKCLPSGPILKWLRCRRSRQAERDILNTR